MGDLARRDVTLSISQWGPRPPHLGTTACALCGQLIEPGETRVDVAAASTTPFHAECFEFQLDGQLAFRERVVAGGCRDVVN